MKWVLCGWLGPINTAFGVVVVLIFFPLLALCHVLQAAGFKINCTALHVMVYSLVEERKEQE